MGERTAHWKRIMRLPWHLCDGLPPYGVLMGGCSEYDQGGHRGRGHKRHAAHPTGAALRALTSNSCSSTFANTCLCLNQMPAARHAWNDYAEAAPCSAPILTRVHNCGGTCRPSCDRDAATMQARTKWLTGQPAARWENAGIPRTASEQDLTSRHLKSLELQSPSNQRRT